MSPNMNFCFPPNLMRIVEWWWIYNSSVFISFKVLRKMTLVDEPLSMRAFLILQLAMSRKMTSVSWWWLMSDESSLSMKEITSLVATLDRGSEVVVFRLATTYTCCLEAEYVIPLTLEPLVMTFTVLSRVGSTLLQKMDFARVANKWENIFAKH